MRYKKPDRKKAVVLLSGGLDSATVLYLAKSRGFDCQCLIFDYGQRHKRELDAARKIAAGAGCRSRIIRISLPWKGSALLDKSKGIPASANSCVRKTASEIPSTYVPARNIIFLSFALSCAEAAGARVIFIGAHAQDYSGYPDCRPAFYRAFQKAAAQGTKAGAEGEKIEIQVPLLNKTKAQIIRLGRSLGVPFALTWSCYRGGKRPCGKCDSCYYRAKGFKEAGFVDPAPLTLPKMFNTGFLTHTAKTGFTLVETIVVIIIIAVMASLGVVNYYRVMEETYDKDAKANLRMIQSAEKFYCMENKEYYPNTGSSTGIDAINKNLSIKLSQEDNPKWNYSVSSDGSTMAVRNMSGGRNWRLDVSSEDPVCTGQYCP